MYKIVSICMRMNILRMNSSDVVVHHCIDIVLNDDAIQQYDGGDDEVPIKNCFYNSSTVVGRTEWRGISLRGTYDI